MFELATCSWERKFIVKSQCSENVPEIHRATTVVWLRLSPCQVVIIVSVNSATTAAVMREVHRKIASKRASQENTDRSGKHIWVVFWGLYPKTWEVVFCLFNLKQISKGYFYIFFWGAQSSMLRFVQHRNENYPGSKFMASPKSSSIHQASQVTTW